MDEPAQNGSPNTPESARVSATTPKSVPERFLQLIFIGPDGLRTGWRVFIYLVAFFLVAGLMIYATKPLLHHHRPPTIWGLLVGELESLVAAIIPALVLSRYEMRPFGAYGLPQRGAFGKQFWFGVVWGICAITLLLAVLHGIKVFDFGALVLQPTRILKFAAFWGLFFLTVGFFEEFLMRGYTQFTLTRGMGFWPAAFLLSFTFGALHFPQEYALGDRWGAWAGALGAASIGLFFCLTLRRTGTLWFAVGMHASWDWGESFLYSVPDSGTVAPGHLLSSSFHGRVWLTGGPVGPEASLLVFALIALMAIVFARVYPAQRKRHNIATQDSTGAI